MQSRSRKRDQKKLQGESKEHIELLERSSISLAVDEEAQEEIVSGEAWAREEKKSAAGSLAEQEKDNRKL